MKLRIAICILILGFVAAGSGAVYYKLRAANFEARWTESMEQLAKAIAAPRPAKLTEPEPVPVPVPKSNVNAPSAALQDEIIRLQAELEEKDQQIADLQSNRTRRPELPSPEEREAQMEELKRTDPEKYEEIMIRREEMRERMQTAFAERAATLLERASGNLTEEEQAQQDYMFQTLEETWQLAEKMASSDTSSEEKQEIRKELFEKSMELRPLLEDERQRQLYELGVSSGYSESEAEEFVNYINETFRATSMPFGGGRRPGR
jgi:hypothetical protein